MDVESQQEFDYLSHGGGYWLGMGCDLPEEGVNHSGKWRAGKKEKDGNEITASHKNARYTIALKNLANLDQRANDPNGVPVGGIIYGGRDSDTSVPVLGAWLRPPEVVAASR